MRLNGAQMLSNVTDLVNSRARNSKPGLNDSKARFAGKLFLYVKVIMELSSQTLTGVSHPQPMG